MLDQDMCPSLAYNSSEALNVLHTLATDVHGMGGVEGLAQSYMETGISVICTAKFSPNVWLQFLGIELLILES